MSSRLLANEIFAFRATLSLLTSIVRNPTKHLSALPRRETLPPGRSSRSSVFCCPVHQVCRVLRKLAILPHVGDVQRLTSSGPKKRISGSVRPETSTIGPLIPGVLPGMSRSMMDYTSSASIAVLKGILQLTSTYFSKHCR